MLEDAIAEIEAEHQARRDVTATALAIVRDPAMPTLDALNLPVVDRWWKFASDPLLTEALTRFMCARQGIEYVPQGSGGNPNAGGADGVRSVCREFLQGVMVDALVRRATGPCLFIEGRRTTDPDGFTGLAVCDQPREDQGGSLYCAAHGERVQAGERGLPYLRESVVEWLRTGGVS